MDVGARIAAISATVSAPDALRERLAAPPGPGSRPRSAVLLAICLVVGAVVLALVARPGDEEPTIAATADVALMPATAPAPRIDPEDGRFVDARVGSVRFPSYGYDAAVRTTGSRRDRIDDRGVLTVFYRGWGRRIGYAVVDGAPLAEPAMRSVWRDGHRYGVLPRGGALIVTWRKDGHTCVLASRSAPLSALLSLATWG
jgi:hypothetical protein